MEEEVGMGNLFGLMLDFIFLDEFLYQQLNRYVFVCYTAGQIQEIS